MKPQINHFNWQKGKLGKPFRLSSVERGAQEKWVNGELKSDWIYVFKYKDNTFFALHYDITGKIVKKINHKDLL